MFCEKFIPIHLSNFAIFTSAKVFIEKCKKLERENNTTLTKNLPLKLDVSHHWHLFLLSMF